VNAYLDYIVAKRLLSLSIDACPSEEYPILLDLKKKKLWELDQDDREYLLKLTGIYSGYPKQREHAIAILREAPKRRVVHHIDGNPRNTKIENLKLVTL